MCNGKHFYIHSIACFYTFCYIAIVRSTFRKLFEIGRTFSSDLYQHYATHVSPGNVVPSNFQHDLFSRCLTMPNVGREATLISGGRETVQHPPSSSLPSPSVGSSLVGRRRKEWRHMVLTGALPQNHPSPSDFSLQDFRGGGRMEELESTDFPYLSLPSGFVPESSFLPLSNYPYIS